MSTPPPGPTQPATTRRVDTVTVDGQPVRSVVVTRTVPAEPDVVWAVLTDPDRVATWFPPVTGDLRPGGRFDREGNASGDVVSCREAEHAALTWEAGGRTSTLDLSLRPVPGGSVVQVDHRDPLTAEQWAEHGPAGVGIGWEQALHSLAGHVVGQAPPTAEELATLLPDAALGWADAAVADGDDPADAAAAAQRSREAYGG